MTEFPDVCFRCFGQRGVFAGLGTLKTPFLPVFFGWALGPSGRNLICGGPGGPGFAYPMTLEDLFSVLGTVGPARGGLASTGNLLHGSLERLDTLLIPR